jgi:AraC-like DNA-binding protein
MPSNPVRSSATSVDTARIWRSGLPGIELFAARYSRRTFGRHTHAAIAVGVVDDGCGEFLWHGSTHRVPRNSLVLIGPGEPHTGGIARHSPSEEPLTYRMLYIEPALAERLLDRELPSFAFVDAGPRDERLAGVLRQLFSLLDQQQDTLAAEGGVSRALNALYTKYGAGRMSARDRDAREPSAVARIRDFLHACPARNISLTELAAIVDLHPAYLNRVFRQATGLPPHAYRTQLRIERARQLLADGIAIANVAQMVGFSDQSKLTNHFSRTVGVSPAQYRAGISSQPSSCRKAITR